MAITPLPGDTARVLTSAVVLNDATSVVKELVDNALDAHATSIAIEISANTLDIVQVKDNGSGIGVEDRLLLCKRGHTSKIRSLEDLEKLGETSLGFRGEALASAAGLSDSVLITTRVDGEVVGTTLTFSPLGQLTNSVSASHSIGTTVRVQNLLSSVPVRKQVVLKTTAKILTNIKNLLYNYAFARPTIRFAFKVLKGKNDKANWSFAPCNHDDTLSVAAAKIVGKDVAALCKQYSISSKDLTELMTSSRYDVSALLIDPANPGISKAGSVGQYISIDRRPVTVDRGTCKEFARLYRRYLAHACNEDISIPQQPFFCLHLQCSIGVYDVNIEPAKDEVAFHEASVVKELLETLLRNCYGKIEENKGRIETGSHTNKAVKPPFNMLLARKQPIQSEPNFEEAKKVVSTGRADSSFFPRIDSASSSESNEVSFENHNTRNNQPKETMHRNMFATDDDDGTPAGLSLVDLTQDDSEHPNPVESNALLYNPFTTAKLHARLLPKNLSNSVDFGSENPQDQLADRDNHTTELLSHSSSTAGLPTKQSGPAFPFPYLPTPTKSPNFIKPYQNPGPPLRRRAPRTDDFDGSDAETEGVARTEDSSHGNAGLLESWIKPRESNVISDQIEDLNDDYAIMTDERRSKYRKIAAQDGIVLPQDNNRPSDHGHQSIAHKPFRSPLKRSPVGSNAQSHTSRLNTSILEGSQPNRANRPKSLVTHDAELSDIMDFERQKKAINQNRKILLSKINPADLAQLQQKSFNSEASVANPFQSASSEKTADIISGPSGYASKFAPTISMSTKEQGHLSGGKLYFAPVLKVDHYETNKPTGRDETYDLNNRAANPSPQVASVSGQLSPHAIFPPPLPVLLTNKSKSIAKPKSKQQKISQLPLEMIPRDVIKHNVLATPQSPFPTSAVLCSDFDELKAHDDYIQTGKNRFHNWSPYSREVNDWQERLKNMVQTMYRAKPHDNSQEDLENNTVPQVEIALSRAIKGHIEIVGSSETKTRQVNKLFA